MLVTTQHDPTLLFYSSGATGRAEGFYLFIFFLKLVIFLGVGAHWKRVRER